MSSANALQLFGTEQPPAPYRIMIAGPLEVRLENGNLRYVRFHGREILRAISYVVRDRDWGTLAPEIRDLDIEEDASGFRISYESEYANQGAILNVKTKIDGRGDGHLSYISIARADKPFETNRCGFNVLHPINGVAGQPVTVEHCDGSLEETVFPDLIDPWQPFKTIRALTNQPAAGLEVVCRLEGDVFEMEDQRNWSDASYKTYVRPLELPWPYLIPAGEDQVQSVTLTVREKVPRPTSMASNTDANSISEGDLFGVNLPKIGLLIDPQEIENTLEHLDLLKEIGPQSLLCHLDPTVGQGAEALAGFRALQEAYDADYDLEYVVACDGDLKAEFDRLRDMVTTSGLKLASLAVCPSVDRQSTPPGSHWPECPPLEDIYEAARAAFPEVPLGGGMFSYFTELNRKRPPVKRLDFITHATNPIVHAADDISVMETLETLPHITRSARAIMGEDKPYRLGPSTIAMRQNPYGSKTFDNPNDERLCMTHDDPRQRGAFAAAWTLGYAAAVAPAGVSKWVPAAFSGPRGLIDADKNTLLPVGQVVARLAGISGAPVRDYTVEGTGKLAVLGADKQSGPRVAVANLSAETVAVNWTERLVLEPYEILWL